MPTPAPDPIRRRLQRARRHIEATLPDRFITKLDEVAELHKTHLIVGYLATSRSGIVADLVKWVEQTAVTLKGGFTSTAERTLDPIRLAMGTFNNQPALVLYWPVGEEELEPLARLLPALCVYWMDTYLNEQDSEDVVEEDNPPS